MSRARGRWMGMAREFRDTIQRPRVPRRTAMHGADFSGLANVAGSSPGVEVVRANFGFYFCDGNRKQGEHA